MGINGFCIKVRVLIIVLDEYLAHCVLFLMFYYDGGFEWSFKLIVVRCYSILSISFIGGTIQKLFKVKGSNFVLRSQGHVTILIAKCDLFETCKFIYFLYISQNAL